MAALIFGPRNSCVRLILGDDVTGVEFREDTSIWGAWSDDPALGFERPMELWVDLVHDHVGEEAL